MPKLLALNPYSSVMLMMVEGCGEVMPRLPVETADSPAVRLLDLIWRAPKAQGCCQFHVPAVKLER